MTSKKQKRSQHKTLKPSQFNFIYVTCPTRAVALKIAKHLVKNRFIACANILKHMESVYSWQGQIHHDHEVVLIAKARRSQFALVAREIKKLHPYECPCIVALPLADATKDYLRWLAG